MRRVSYLLAVSGALAARPALAHHLPGHGTGDASRLGSLDALASPAPRSRMVWDLGWRRSSTPAGPLQLTSASLSAEFAPRPWLGLNANLPFHRVRLSEPGGGEQFVGGLGDSSVGLRVTPHADKLRHRLFTVGFNASFATRSYRLAPDPGATRRLSSFVAYQRNHDRVFWQARSSLSVEQRPSGYASDLGVAGSFGGRLTPSIAMVGELRADLRVGNWCARSDATQWCAEGRVGDPQREVGAIRPSAGTALVARLPQRARAGGESGASVFVAVRAPLAPRRSFDVATNLGVQLDS